jgi:hypothetical protein
MNASTKTILNNDTNNSEETTIGEYLGITHRWTPFYYLSGRGVEHFHIYLWISKDLAWLNLFVDLFIYCNNYSSNTAMHCIIQYSI